MATRLTCKNAHLSITFRLPSLTGLTGKKTTSKTDFGNRNGAEIEAAFTNPNCVRGRVPQLLGDTVWNPNLQPESGRCFGPDLRLLNRALCRLTKTSLKHHLCMLSPVGPSSRMEKGLGAPAILGQWAEGSHHVPELIHTRFVYMYSWVGGRLSPCHQLLPPLAAET